MLPHSKLKDRWERVSDTNVSLTKLFISYNEACAKLQWTEADRLRTMILETTDTLLDGMAAIYKVHDHGKA